MIAREGERLVVRGPLTIATVPALFEEGLRHLNDEDLLVDFSQAETVDSAAVSMLLGWARAAQRGQHSLRVAGLPKDLLSLAHLYGVADMLPQEPVNI
ncbi:MAG: STAS domain-containing protein [Gallionellaceae bacterium]|nr:STAS domain-containing protein [Gallionellaceae bacterium]